MMGERTPFDVTDEEVAAAAARDLAAQEGRVEELLPKLLAVLPEVLDEFFFDSKLSQSAQQRYTAELAKALLTWMDEQRYDPWGNLATIEIQGAVLNEIMMCFEGKDDGTYTWRPGIAMLPQALIKRITQYA